MAEARGARQLQAEGPLLTALTFRYLAPYAFFLLFLLAGQRLPFDWRWEAPLRFALLGAICVVCWPRDLSLRPAHPLLSAGVGALVFLIWIAPEVLDPHYRQHLLFSNSVVGSVHSSANADALQNGWFLLWRTLRAAILAPVVEELFWRGWLMRWLVRPEFETVPLGTYTPVAFWATALLFASEHGPYWDVGLAAGIIYNWWMIRVRSIADCIWMHAVTNGLLSGYVILAKQWQYWQ